MPEGVDRDMLADMKTRVERGPVDDTPAMPTENRPVHFEISPPPPPATPGDTPATVIIARQPLLPPHQPPAETPVTSPGHPPPAHQPT